LPAQKIRAHEQKRRERKRHRDGGDDEPGLGPLFEREGAEPDGVEPDGAEEDDDA